MKIFKKALAIIAIVSVIVSAFALPASAKNVCREIKGKSGTYGGTKTIFYADAKNTKSHYIKVSCEKGKYQNEGGWSFENKNIYDYYNVKVYGKSGKNWKLLSDDNYKNKSSFKVTFSGYKEYKFEFWSWKISTIEKNAVYFPHPATRKPFLENSVCWKVQPTWKVSRTSGMTDCDSLYY